MLVRMRLGTSSPIVLVVLAPLFVACSQESAAPPTVGSAAVGVHNGGGGFDASLVDSNLGVGSGSGLVTLATGVVSPRAIVLSPSTVYWTTGQVASIGALVGDASAGTGGIESVPRGGGARTEVLDGLSSPRELAFYGTTLFFVQGQSGAGTVDEYLLGSTAISRIAAGQTPPLPMVVDEGTLYWAGQSGSALDIFATPTGADHVSTLASLGADAGNHSPVALTAVGTTLYLLESGSDGASILEVAGSGGAPKSIWHDASFTPSDLASEGTSLYWIGTTSTEGGEVLAMGVSGGTPATLASNLDNPGRLAVDGSQIYLTSDVAGGSVLAVSTGGGGVTTLATGLDYPFAVAVDDAVYFTTATTVARVPREGVSSRGRDVFTFGPGIDAKVECCGREMGPASCLVDTRSLVARMRAPQAGTAVSPVDVRSSPDRGVGRALELLFELYPGRFRPGRRRSLDFTKILMSLERGCPPT
jgi:hypothetical protein